MKNSQQIIELRRFAIRDDAPANTGSRLLSIMRKKIKQDLPEIKLLISYQDEESHKGTIYRAAGWVPTVTSNGLSWTTEKRTRNKEQTQAKKIRWETTV
jgi:hypothetical protein